MRYLLPKTRCTKLFSKSANVFSLMAFVVLIMLLASATTAFAQNIIYVDVNATGNNDGTSWEHAFNELQDIPQSFSGSYEVWVAEGTYKPTTGNDQTASFEIPGNVSLLGGFEGSETSADERNWEANKTIISGDLDDSGTANAGDSHSLITIVNSDNVTIDGFIIENSYADNDAENTPLAIGRAGAGIYARFSDNLNINNCIFHHNVAQGNGTDSGVGGAMINFGDASTTTTITNTLFYENTATGGGGAISGESGSIELINSTIADNIAGHGGGIHFYNATVSAVNSIFTNNSGANGNMNDGGGSGSGIISYSMFYNIYGAGGQLPDNITDGGNNIYETDPLYNSGGNVEGYRLLPESPAIDVGDNTGNSLDKDLAAEDRIQDGDLNNTTTIDLGAFEFVPPAFSELTGVGLAGVALSSVAWGDYDNDGDLDLLITGDTGSDRISKIYTNNGNGGFSELTGIGLTGVDRSSVAWGDYDNDGDLDILLTGEADSEGAISKIYTNNGGGSFSELTSAGLTGVFYSSVAWGDYDNDGDLDVLLTGSANPGYYSAIYTNNGDGSFTELTGAGLTGTVRSSAAWADYDNDGDLDILISGLSSSGGISKIYTNNGNGDFSELSGTGIPGVERASIAWGDYDNDGDLDILVSGYHPSGLFTKVYTNNGNGSFNELSGTSFPDLEAQSIAWGDYDNDGDLDILLTGWTYGPIGTNQISKIYTNNGNGNFTESTEAGLTGVSASSVAWGDYDNDGDLDVLLTGETPSNRIATIYTNHAGIVNTLPTTPTNPVAVLSNDKQTIEMSWDTATDNETPDEGLSYNVFVKEDPPGTPEYIKSPMAQENDGWRKLPALGNAMQNTSYTWNLPEASCGGTADFTFRVQAIDHAYAGSEFSSETGFSIDLTDTPSTLYVDANATGSDDGSDWNNAFTNLQDALNYACFTGEIWVAQGTYKPGTDQADSFEIPEGVILLGGFDGMESSVGERNWAEHPTILSGDLDDSNTPDEGDSHTIIRIESDDVTVDGFIVEHGFADDGSTLSGRTGAGFYADQAENLVINNTIFRNLVADGGPDNGVGGALIAFSGTMEISNSLFHDNEADFGGAVSLEDDAGLNLINATLAGNHANDDGGALNTNDSPATITNTVFSDNTSAGEANINGTTTSVEYSYLQNETPAGTGNIDGTAVTDPLFADAGSNDYALQENSGLVNAGDNASSSSSKDLAGNDRIFDTTIDIGAYELQEEPFSIGPDENNVLFVDKNVSSGDGSGDSWANAIPELADALKWAREQHVGGSPGWDDTDPLQIWVAEGTYNPLYNAANGSYTEDGGRDNAFVLVPNVQLYGGFDPDEGIEDLSNDRILPTTPGFSGGTILSGDLDENDNPDDFDNHTNNAYHVLLLPVGLGEATVNGLTIRGGSGDGSGNITVLSRNFNRSYGGGVYNFSNIPVEQVHITHNRVLNTGSISSGGGIYDLGSSAYHHVIITDNYSENQGGGMELNGGNPGFVNVLVAGNAARQGGGVFVSSGSPVFTNAAITGNTADADVGGFFIISGTVNLFNSIVWGNTSDSGLEVLNIVGSFTAGNSIVGGGAGGGLDADPLFADPENGDYTLQATSPAINAGDNEALPEGVMTDLAGNPRVDAAFVDMGAYEFQCEPVTVPGPVVLSAPADEAANVGLTPEFSWESLDGADKYQLQVSENDEFSSTVIDESELEDTMFEPSSDLDNSATYYWRVRASNAAGSGEWSEVFGFTTLPESSAVVILTDPSDDSEDVPLTPLFEWNPTDGADSYDLIVSPNGDLSDPVIDEDEIENTEFQLTGDLGFSTTYHWRVRGVNTGGPGQWSDVFSFTTRARPEAADNRILLANADSYTFSSTDFGTVDNSFTIIIDDLPGGFNGTLKLDGNPVSTDDEISVGDIDDGKLIYTPPSDRYGYGFDRFEFSLQDGSGNISDDSYTMSLDVAATSVNLNYDEEGWRFLSSPAGGETVGDFFEPIWTQGFAGSDSPTASFANIQTLNQDEYEWEPVTDAGDNLDAGDAVIAYVYEDDDNNGFVDGFPKILISSTDDWMNLDGEYDETLAYNADQQDTGDSFFLWGNPYPIAIDLCEADLINIAGNAYYWDHSLNSGNGDYVNLSCAADDVEIAPFQSVWLRVADNSNTLEIPADTYMDETTNGYFKQNQSEDQFLITMNLSSETHSKEEPFTTSTRILFDEEASVSSDLIDAPKLSSAGLTNRYLSFYSLSDNNKAYALQALSAIMDEKVSIPLDIQTTESGRFTLDWDLPESHVFSGSYFLRDNTTGEVMELKDGSSYRFEITEDNAIQTKEAENTHPMSGIAGTSVFAQDTHRMNSKATPRFELLIATVGVDGLTELGAVPDNFTLAQNYPNPFNPTTVIRYQLPTSSEVRLEVYDMLGRNVATLVNEQIAAGQHAVNFDASNLSSGVYLYRLQAGSQIMTKKLTILK